MNYRLDEAVFYDRMRFLGGGEAVSVHREFFDKLTVKPNIGSESAAPAMGYAPRSELKNLSPRKRGTIFEFGTFGAYARKC